MAVGMIAHTGDVCPVSGVWRSLDMRPTTAPIARGNRMPPHDGGAVDWQLIQLA
ncbi:hypothetical protein [Mycobacterium sp. 23]|uniref:hypothetical protein n=1 Tax=Mycobacterium sp. 23 TaxID=3400424 RepID=UPI003AAF58E8